MRTNLLPRLILFLLSAMCAGPLLGQTVHTVTLYVNTAEVNSKNTDKQCNFGQAENISNVDYTIKVKRGDIIVWKGVSTNAPETDLVSIKAINHEGGVNVFGQNVLKGNGQEPEIVTGTVVQGAPGDEEKYKLSFRVFNDGSRRGGTLHIDPKIQVH